MSGRESEIEEIVLALDVLLRAIKQDNEARRGDVSAPRSAADIQWTFRETKLELAAYDLLQSPVGQALRNGVKLLGARLNERGGTQLMHETLDRVCNLQPDEDSWREAMLDRLWSGIGSWIA